VTIEERFERIEYVTAGLAEERRKDREEARQLWRDTQRQLGELATRINDLAIHGAEEDDRLRNRIDQLAEESRAADRRLGDRMEALDRRIESTVSGIGEFIAGQKKGGDQ
jgi:hypothetical protein